MKRPMVVGGKDAGWVETERGYVAGHELRQRYHDAGKNLKKAKRELEEAQEKRPEAVPVKAQDLARAQREMDDCEDAVKCGWDES